MSRVFWPFFANADHLLRGGHVLLELELGRLPMDAADYRTIAIWASDILDHLDTRVLLRLRREGPSALKLVAENALSDRGEPAWATDEKTHEDVRRAWDSLLQRVRRQPQA
jgi:hypothetical protein